MKKKLHLKIDWRKGKGCLPEDADCRFKVVK